FLLLPATEAPRTTRRSTRSPLKPACPAPPEAPTVKMTRRVSEAANEQEGSAHEDNQGQRLGGTTMSLALACAATRRGTPRGRRDEGAWCAGGRPRGPRVPPPPQAKASPEARQLFASPDWLVGRLSQAHQACCTEGAGARFPSKNNKQLK
ncbi:unnamed protein product, partial [Prorocentrum cordatum]